MKRELYTQQFEDETRGYYSVKRKSIIISLLFTMMTCGLIVGSFILISKTNNISSKTKTINLETNEINVKGKYEFKPSTPTSFPTTISYSYEDDDDVDSIRRKSKYPTRHPRKKTSVPSLNMNTMFPIVTFTSIDSMSPISIDSMSPINLIVTDDFHVTPIVVINNDKKEDHDEKNQELDHDQDKDKDSKPEKEAKEEKEEKVREENDNNISLEPRF
jgi:hypothetical protein